MVLNVPGKGECVMFLPAKWIYYPVNLACDSWCVRYTYTFSRRSCCIGTSHTVWSPLSQFFPHPSLRVDPLLATWTLYWLPGPFTGYQENMELPVLKIEWHFSYLFWIYPNSTSRSSCKFYAPSRG